LRVACASALLLRAFLGTLNSRLQTLQNPSVGVMLSHLTTLMRGGCALQVATAADSCSISRGIPASCRTQLSSSLASTWITTPHKPRRRSMEKESDGPQLAGRPWIPAQGQ